MDRGAVDNPVVELLGQPAVVVRVEVAAMPKVDGYGAEKCLSLQRALSPQTLSAY